MLATSVNRLKGYNCDNVTSAIILTQGGMASIVQFNLIVLENTVHAQISHGLHHKLQ